MFNFSNWKAGTVIVICLIGVLFALPNTLPQSLRVRLPSWLQPVKLGLDLKGGSHLLIGVKVHDVIHGQIEDLSETVRSTLRQSNIRYRLSVADNGLYVFVMDVSQLESTRDLLRKIDRETTVELVAENKFYLVYEKTAVQKRRDMIVLQAIEIVRRRIDESGIHEASVLRHGQERFIVELPGIDNPDHVKRLIGRTARLTLHLVDERTSQQREQPSLKNLTDTYFVSSLDSNEKILSLYRKVEISGEDLADTRVSFQNNRPVVNFHLNSLGGRKFSKMTRENVGKRLAIVLDDKVISAPVIREPIVGGSGIISGNFTVQEAQDLALLLRAGALPAPLTYLEERTVGPSLGADSIRSGAIACLIGLGSVVVFMWIVYGLLGLFANLALLTNLVLLVGFLGAIGVTLTMPGIAGIVLTLGMAVDANVLIYEHMREEKHKGRSIFNALDIGFQRAFVTIFDANLTTLIATILLFQFGSGPIRGFAVTLGIGIITSVFTAVMITRLIITLWIRRHPTIFPLY